MVLWWIANVVALLVVVPLVLFLANRIINAAVEITRYADDVLAHGVALTANLDPVPQLVRTRELVGVAKGHAVNYVNALDRMVATR